MFGDSFVYKIQLCTGSFMTSAVWHCYDLHFVHVCLITLYMFRGNLFPSNIFYIFQNTFFVLKLGSGVMREGGISQQGKTGNLSARMYFLLWTRSSDRSWQLEDGKCALCFCLRLVFHYLLPAPNNISWVQRLCNCLIFHFLCI